MASAQASKLDREVELTDLGVFEGDRYFDVEVRYAKAAPDDVLIELVVTNRAAVAAELHVLPQLWFRNTWSWEPGRAKPVLEAEGATLVARHAGLGTMVLHAAPAPGHPGK